MKVGVIGKGTVGSAVYQGIEHIGHDVCFFDPKFEGSRIEDVLNAELVFVCVPTDMLDNGDCDTSIVERVISELNSHAYTGLIAIKSTVIPGTTDRMKELYPNLRICCVPEFLRAKIALADFVYNHDVLVIGSLDPVEQDLVRQAHGHIPKKVSCVSPVEAEVVKYFNNVHHSMSIIFANIAYDVCKKLGAEYGRVYDTITQRDCFNPHYLMAHEKLRGYGGHCLPKDTAAWNKLVRDLGLDYTMIQSIIDDNARIR